MPKLLGNLSESIGKENSYVLSITRSPTRMIVASANLINPGDVLFFKYKNDPDLMRLVLVVSNRKGWGVYVSSKFNMLMSCFYLGASPKMTEQILGKLYKNRAKSSYGNVVLGLKALLGKRNYRTFKLRDMYSIHQLDLEI